MLRSMKAKTKKKPAPKSKVPAALKNKVPAKGSARDHYKDQVAAGKKAAAKKKPRTITVETYLKVYYGDAEKALESARKDLVKYQTAPGGKLKLPGALARIKNIESIIKKLEAMTKKPAAKKTATAKRSAGQSYTPLIPGWKPGKNDFTVPTGKAAAKRKTK